MGKMVKTVGGQEHPLLECRKINGQYYKIGDINVEGSGDCFFMESRNKYSRLETGYIIYDHRLQRYVYKSNYNLVEGVIAFVDNNPIFGNFSSENFSLLERIIIKGDTYYCLLSSSEINKAQSLYLEDMKNGIFCHRQSKPCYNFFKKSNPSSSYKSSLPYDSNGRMESVIADYNNLYKPKYSKACDKYGEFMKDLTFGLEFETSMGFIPEKITKKLGLMPLRDGSVEGLEYVTIPLKGKKGVQTVLDSLTELNKRTEHSEKCSLHLHLGNIPRTEGFFIALYKMLFLLQDSIFEMFPVYKKVNYGVKRKHYTKPLDFKNTIMLMDSKITKSNMSKNFEVLFRYLSMGADYKDYGKSLDNVHSHPSDPHGRSKWNIKTRYFWVNFIPLLFGNKQTIEFRIHTPTDDPTKVINYMIMCSSIINYTIENEKTILENFESISNTTLSNVVWSNLSSSTVKNYDDLYSYYQDYIDNRKGHFYRAAASGMLKEDENNFKNFSKYIGWGSNMVKTKPWLFDSNVYMAELKSSLNSLDRYGLADVITYTNHYVQPNLRRTRRNPSSNNASVESNWQTVQAEFDRTRELIIGRNS